MPSTEQLLRRIATRDRDAFCVVFERFAPRIAGLYAKSGVPPELRDELVQDVMLRVWRKAEQFDAGRASAATWIFTIARNARIDLMRKPAVRATVEPLDPAFVDEATPEADEVVAQAQRARDLRVALADLPDEQATILRAAYFEHKTLRAIASEWGLALGTVKSRVRLAFHRLRGTLGGERS